MSENNKKKNVEKQSENNVVVDLSRYKNLIVALGNPTLVTRMVLLIFVVVILLGIGIVGVVCGVKHFYPYKSINTNPYGATIIKDEDNEVIYWLYNSADMWANSGIEVKKGDIITVRTSGAFSPAMHHIVDAAKANKRPESMWTSPSGYTPERMDIRKGTQFRISPNAEPNVILMQSVPKKIASNPNWRSGNDTSCWNYIDGWPNGIDKNNNKEIEDNNKDKKKDEDKNADIYIIGKEKGSVEIRRDGILHFACNEIAFTGRVLDSIDDYYQNWYKREDNKRLKKNMRQEGNKYRVPIGERSESESVRCAIDTIPIFYKEGDILSTAETMEDSAILLQSQGNFYLKVNNRLYQLGGCEELKQKKNYTKYYKQLQDKEQIRNLINNRVISIIGDTIIINEFQNYKSFHFVDAWFADNVGSFLIIIERKKVK